MQVQPQRKPAKETRTTDIANELTEAELGKVSAGAFNTLANFGDIKGESTEKDHKDWVQILDYGH